MIAASIFDHPGLLLLIAFIALVRWLITKAKSQAKEGQSPLEPPPAKPISRGGQTQSEEERIKKFLEALGQPAGSAPPPKVTQRRRPVTPKIFPSPLPPLVTVPPPLPQEEFAPFVAPPPLPAKTVAPKRLATDYQVQEVVRQTSSEPRPTSGVARFKLGTPQDLRTAIILREIFGPPRSLQSFDLTSGS